MLQAQEKEIRNKTTLIISLIVLLGILFMFLYRENFLKRKLKVSESELKIRMKSSLYPGRNCTKPKI